MKHLIIHDHEGAILAIAEPKGVDAPHGTSARLGVALTAKQRVVEIDLSEANRGMSWREVIEGMVVDVSGAAPILRAKSVNPEKRRS
ncbi:MAG: hypothetical protein GIW99_07440 [Candidatus Eremiobacteraeota bacterium]|nr:hypothetical protein [Candidatus Eremiobacteraeota bacterium]MBC5827497.1 hypothetical protein [Candidatus Eremiobacteraeota bacterium]